MMILRGVVLSATVLGMGFGLSSCIFKSSSKQKLVDIQISAGDAEESAENIPYSWIAYRAFAITLTKKQRDYYGYITIHFSTIIDGVEGMPQEISLPPSDASQSLYKITGIYDYGGTVDYTQHTTQFKIVIDPYNLIPESRESNNTIIATAFHIPASNG